MNNKFINILFVIFGFLAHLMFANSPEWNIVGILGILICGVGAANLSYGLFPNTQTYKDWLVPAVLLVVCGLIAYFIRSQGYFGITGQPQVWLNTIITATTIVPLVRLYAHFVHYRDSL